VATGGSGGSILIQPATTCVDGSLGCIPNGRIFLNGNLNAAGGSGTAAGSDGDISLAPLGRAQIPSIATIVSSYSGNDVTLAGGTILIGATDSVSIIGSFTANFSNLLIVSNLVARDAISINGPILVFVPHSSEIVLTFTGALGTISGEHIVSRDNTMITATVLGNASNIKTSPLSQGELQTVMQYTPNSYVLDYDIGITPVPPTPSTVTCNCNPPIKLSFPEFSMLNVIADAQLTDELIWFNEGILNGDYYLESQFINGETELRYPLEYRKYTAKKSN
jgi:hypothetical protein